MGRVVCFNFENDLHARHCLVRTCTSPHFYASADLTGKQVEIANAPAFVFHYPAPWHIAHLDFLRTLKQRYPSTPILVTSTELNATAALMSFRWAKAVDFIVIPSEGSHLRTTIETISKRTPTNRNREVYFPATRPEELVRLQVGDKLIEQAAYFVSQNYSTKFSIDDVARHCHTSSTSIYRIFKSEYECSFREYVKRYRLQKAEELLKSTDLPVFQIAHKTGYEDVSLFTRLFKERFGCAPSTARYAI